MTAFFNKFGKTLALAAAAATVLALAFFLTDDNIKKNILIRSGKLSALCHIRT